MIEWPETAASAKRFISSSSVSLENNEELKMKIVSVTFTLKARPLLEDKKKTNKKNNQQSQSFWIFIPIGGDVLGNMTKLLFSFCPGPIFLMRKYSCKHTSHCYLNSSFYSSLCCLLLIFPVQILLVTFGWKSTAVWSLMTYVNYCDSHFVQPLEYYQYKQEKRNKKYEINKGVLSPRFSAEKAHTQSCKCCLFLKGQKTRLSHHFYWTKKMRSDSGNTRW